MKPLILFKRGLFLLFFLAFPGVNIYSQCTVHASFTATTQTHSGIDTVLTQNTSTSSRGIVRNSWQLSQYSGGAWVYITSNYAKNPVFTVSGNSLYRLCLTVTDSSGCTDSICQNISTGSGCHLSASFYTVVTGSAVLTYNTTPINISPFSSYWSFPGGVPSSSTAANATTTYANPGTYQICLVVRDTAGCSDSICHNVTVTNCHIHAGYSYTLQNADALNPDTVIFTNTSTPLNLITSYGLSAYDGSGNLLSSASSGVFPRGLIIPDDTLRRVCLVVHDSAGTCSDTMCQNILSQPCAAHAAFFTSIDSNSNVVMHNGSTGSPSFISYWSFPGGSPSSSTVTNPVVSYEVSGTYQICLVVSSPSGCLDSTCHSVTVNHCNLHAGYSYTLQNADVLNPDTVIFTNTSTPLNLISSYGLNVYDGGGNLLSAASSGVFPRGLIIPDDTLRRVCLVVHDSAGICNDTLCQNILSRGCSIHASFTTSVSGSAVLTYNTTVSNTLPYTSYWSFPGGVPSSSTSQNASVTYPHNGTYQICLVVRSPGGCADSVCHNVTIGGCSLHASYSYTLQNADPLNPDTLILTNSSSPLSQIYSYNLNVFNGAGGLTSGSSGAFPASLIIPNDTLRKVCLVVHDSSRTCADTMCQSITSHSPCNLVASFTTTISGSAVLCYNTSTGYLPYNSYWSFPGGVPSSSTTANPTVTYPSHGTHVICLVVTNAAGCIDSICKSVGTTVSPGQAREAHEPTGPGINAAQLGVQGITGATGGTGAQNIQVSPETAGVVENNIVSTIADQQRTGDLTLQNLRNELNQVEIMIRPNPFSSSTTVEISGAGTDDMELSVYDLSGKLVRNERLTSKLFRFDKADLSPGMYLFEIRQNRQSIGQGKLMIL